MTITERNNKLKHFITCLKCEVSGKCCDDNCSTQYDAGNMGEIIENLEAISKALEQESTTKNDLGVNLISKSDVDRIINCPYFRQADKLIQIMNLPSVTFKDQLPTKNDLGVDCISRADAIKAMQEKAKKLTNEDTINGLCGAVAILFDLPSVTPQKPRCKDCKWWKDSDGIYRRGCNAESECPINTHEVCCGEGYCYMFSPNADMRDEEV